ncbi:hypothetical protein FNF29_00168 [Cafeteria roenbergensis]|uniref:DASH complex subunit DAD1 n=1 Tax=Cafeteria roenbergensis TaxID=33653 RepID=A0A5A8CWN8_CAFRO|nr:hypothetical protein FNF29_00168 [Cafeteria roenbergensis]|eukprot:KAA0157592.1 hypothetical protein FNF29_00168 [Cafeteria roenbergensis]
MASSSAAADREREYAEHTAAFRQERLELLQDINTLAQDAAMNFGSLNDNLDRLIGLTQSVAATRPTWQALARSTFGQHATEEAESKQS